MAEVTNSTQKVIADVPEETREKIDRLGGILDLKMGQMVREAIDRTIPIWEERAAERLRATATAGN